MTAVANQPARTFGDLSGSRQNHFDLLRLILSMAVLYSHSYALSGQRDDAIARLCGHQTLASGLALFGFFVVSGYLIAGSWERSKSLVDFAARRARRIVPGFIVAIFFCFLIVGPLGADSISRYFQDISAWRFLGFLAMKVPESVSSTLHSNPDAGALNGSLWTIRLEVSCYFLTALAGTAGILKKRGTALGLAIGICVVWTAMHVPPLVRWQMPSLYVWGMMQMTVPFAIGLTSYVWRSTIPASWWVCTFCIACLGITAVLGGMTYAIWFAGGYLFLFFGLWPGGPSFLRRIGDLSYGVYLYAFPIQQLTIRWLHNPGPWAVTAIAIPCTLGLAWLSWTFVESPFLKRSSSRRPSSLMPRVAIDEAVAGVGA